MPLSHYDHESQESPRIDQDSWGFVIPLLHYYHESHESLRIDNFLDSWLNRYQFVKFLPVSYIFVVSSDQSGIRGKSFELFKVLITSQVFSAGIWTFSNCLHHFAQTHLAFAQACSGVSYVCLSTYILHCLILLIFDL